jgi:hypothetical protein
MHVSASIAVSSPYKTPGADTQAERGDLAEALALIVDAGRQMRSVSCSPPGSSMGAGAAYRIHVQPVVHFSA